MAEFTTASPRELAGINPVGKHSLRRSGCQAIRRQIASLDRRIFTGTSFSWSRIMLRMVALGLLIPLGVGVLSAMELRTPPRNPVAVVPPIAETNTDASDSHGALAKADRLDVAIASNETSLKQMAAAISETPPQQIAAASSETPEQPALIDEPASPSEEIRIAPSEPPKPISRQRHDPKPKKAAAAARHKPKPKLASIKPADIKAAGIKTAGIKRTVVSERSRAAANPEPCRLKAFGGLLRALNSTDCEI